MGKKTDETKSGCGSSSNKGTTYENEKGGEKEEVKATCGEMKETKSMTDVGIKSGEKKSGCSGSTSKALTFENKKEQGCKKEEVNDDSCGEMKTTKSKTKAGEKKSDCGGSTSKDSTFEKKKEQGGIKEEVKDNSCGEMKETKSKTDVGMKSGEKKIGCGGSTRKGSTFEKKKEQVSKKKEVKDNSCGEMKETKSKIDVGIKSGEKKSGCGGSTSKGSTFQKEEVKDNSYSDMKKTKSMTDLKSYRRSTHSNSTFKIKGEGKHSSVSSSVQSKCSSKNGPKCHISREAFKRGLEEPSDLEEIGDCQCNTSYVEFLKSGSKKENNDPPKKLCAHDPTQVIGKCTKYSNSSIKVCDICMDFPKKYVKHNVTPKNNIVVEKCDPIIQKGGYIIPKKHPCPPTAEGGITKATKQSMSSFFQLDARNKKLNECVGKYMTDSTQKIDNCSQYEHIIGKSKACNKIAKKILKDCFPTLQYSRRHRLLSIWGPPAAICLAATTAFTFWVTRVEGSNQDHESNTV